MPSHLFRRAVAFTATTAAVCALALTSTTAASAAIVPAPITDGADASSLTLTPIGTHETSIFDESAAEIVHAYKNRLFVVNAQAGSVTVLDYSNPTTPTQLFAIEADGVANSLAVRDDGLGVIAIEDATKTAPGRLVFFDADAATPTLLGSVTVGSLPDMVTITDDGAYAVVANEGEPADDFTVDPEGTVGVVALPTTKTAPTQEAVRLAGFEAFEGDALPEGVRVFGPDIAAPDQAGAEPSTNRVSRNLEPEYIAIDGGTAYAALQEANSVAVVDIASATVTDIWPLGYKDLGAVGNGIDASNDDDAINIATYDDLFGLYMPDGLNAYKAGGETYLVSANEGDSREWGEFVDASRVAELAEKGAGPVCADSPLAGLTDDADLGRLNVITDLGLTGTGEDACYSELYAFGGRSFSIWNTDGEQVFDSGDDFEQVTAAVLPDNFNSTHTESNFDNRSDDKGPEPENLAIGEVNGRTYAFIGLERVGGVMVYDITDPAGAKYVSYVNNRDFSVSGEDDLANAGDLGAEGLEFIPAASSPTGKPLLAVANEVSGTTTLFSITDPETVDLTLLGINDFHGRIDANTVKFAGTIEQQREAAAGDALFLSVGDNIGASLFASSYFDDEPTLDVLNALDLQTSAVGNHEFDQGFDDLTGRVDASADFSYLGANVYERGTETPALPEYETFEVQGLTVGVIGTVTEETGSLVSPAGIADIEFGDPVDAVNRVTAELTDGNEANGEADVIVALYHEGASAGDVESTTLEAELAKPGDFARIVQETSPAVSAIFTGHTHKKYAWSAPIPGTDRTRPIVQTGSYGENIGRIVLTLDAETGELLSHNETNVARTTADDDALAERYDRVADVQAIVDEALAEAQVIGNQKVAEVSSDITTAFTGGGFVGGVYTGTTRDNRAAESTLGNLVAEALRSSFDDLPDGGADIGVTNPGGLRDELYDTQAEFGGDAIATLEDGDISFSQALAVLPFANTTTLVTLTGEQFTTVLEQQWQRLPNGTVPGRAYLQLGLSDNVTYTYDETRPEGDRITSVTVDGEPLDPAREYRVGTLSFLADGGDNFRGFTEASSRLDTGNVDYEAWIDYLEAGSPVAPDFAKHAVQVQGSTTAAAGTSAQFTVSNLNLTSLGSPETTELAVWLGDDQVGTVPVTAGSAEVSVPLPADTAAGVTDVVLISEAAGTEVTVPVTVTAGLPGTGGGTPPVPVNPGGNPPAAGVQTGDDWATVTLSNGGRVEQGGTLTVTLTGLTPGQTVAATVFSDPIAVSGIPAADASGRLSFTVAIPSDLDLGAHRLVLTTAGESPIQVGLTVVSPGALAVTGAEMPLGIALLGALLLVAGGAAFTMRKRRESVS